MRRSLKVISFLLIISLLGGMFPAETYASDAIYDFDTGLVYTMTDNKAQIVNFSTAAITGGFDGNLVIPPELGGAEVTGIDPHAFNISTDKTLIISVELPASVTGIGEYAFANCTSLQSMFIPDTVTAIGTGAFAGCSLTIYGEAGSAAEDYVTAAADSNIQFSAGPGIIPINVRFDKNIEQYTSQADVTARLLCSGWDEVDQIEEVNGDSHILVSEDYWSVSGNILTISKEYLSSKPIGTLQLSVQFTSGSQAVLILKIRHSEFNEISEAWKQIKDNAMPQVYLQDEFGTPYMQPLATMGYEDGIHMSPDGLHLYCTYQPTDFLAWVMNGVATNTFDVFALEMFMRGPSFGMDLASFIPGRPELWLHSDILHASRESVDEPFTRWELSGMAQPITSEGAPTPFYNNEGVMEKMLLTRNTGTDSNMEIFSIDTSSPNPDGTGTALPAPVNSAYNEDNPCMIRVDENTLVLFIDDHGAREGNLGGRDIWYSVSGDNGASWSEFLNVTTVSGPGDQHQPFLWKDEGGLWWMYYTATNPDNFKMAVYRAYQETPGDWNSWSGHNLVVDSGTAAGIGECTVTSRGDLSVVVTYVNEEGGIYDKYEADPWFIPIKQDIAENPGTEEPDTEQPGNRQAGSRQASSTPAVQNTGIAQVLENGKVIISVTEDYLQAAAKSGKSVVIEADGAYSEVSDYVLELPASALDGTRAAEPLQFKTPAGNLILTGDMLKEFSDPDSVSVELQKDTSGTRPAVVVNIRSVGKTIPWKSDAVPVKISIPYIPAPEESAQSIVLAYVAEDGTSGMVKNGRYNPETGMLEGYIRQPGKYAVVYNYKTFADIKGHLYGEEVELLASRGIIGGRGNDTYAPEAEITRADFILMLVRMFDFTGQVSDNFSDVPSSKYYYQAVGIAGELKLVSGTGGDRLDPESPISRQDMATILSRALKLYKGSLNFEKADLSQFTDYGDASAYALDSLGELAGEGILGGNGGKLLPKGNITRGEAAAVLARVLEKYIIN